MLGMARRFRGEAGYHQPQGAWIGGPRTHKGLSCMQVWPMAAMLWHNGSIDPATTSSSAAGAEFAGDRVCVCMSAYGGACAGSKIPSGYLWSLECNSGNSKTPSVLLPASMPPPQVSEALKTGPLAFLAQHVSCRTDQTFERSERLPVLPSCISSSAWLILAFWLQVPLVLHCC